jgi:hypothetical protein
MIETQDCDEMCMCQKCQDRRAYALDAAMAEYEPTPTSIKMIRADSVSIVASSITGLTSHEVVVIKDGDEGTATSASLYEEIELLYVPVPEQRDPYVIFGNARKQHLKDCQPWKRKKKGRS